MLDQRLSQLRAEHHAVTLAITTAKDVPAIDLETEEEQAKLSSEYRKLSDELTRAQTALEASATTKITAATLTARRRDISAQIDTVRQNLATATTDLRRRLANKERAAEVQRLIDEAKESEKKIAERIAELERLEFAAAAYTKANIEAVEAAINSRFNLVRWRMYEQTIEGADVETCVATIDGVPFNSLNSAGQVLAGLDIIRTFCRYYGATAPVFIDNAESISQTDLRSIRRSFVCKWSRVLHSNLKQRNDMAQIVSNEKDSRLSTSKRSTCGSSEAPRNATTARRIWRPPTAAITSPC